VIDLVSVFATGLFAGGASCAAVQGGLLAGTVASRRTCEPPIAPGDRSVIGDQASRGLDLLHKHSWTLDGVPVLGFLAGKLVSHTILGALLGLAGSALELGWRARALTQIIAGLVMIALAAHLLGVEAVSRLIPRPPARVSRWIRRSSKSQLALAPALLGVATVLIPCGITLSVEVLAVASGSAWAGAAIMATFVVGTSPLFATIGYLFRRSATALRGRLSKLAGVAVVAAGIFSINAGLVLMGSSLSLNALWDGGFPASSTQAVTVTPGIDGIQDVVIDVHATSYTPSLVSVKAGAPVRVTFHTDGVTGCTRGVVFPSLNIDQGLPRSGSTAIDLGRLPAGRLVYTCSMGMYHGAIDVG
jgi:sulfite exporter TauE/SafE